MFFGVGVGGGTRDVDAGPSERTGGPYNPPSERGATAASAERPYNPPLVGTRCEACDGTEGGGVSD